MLLDIRHIGAEPLEADLCIVGGGAAGLTLAAALAPSGRHIIVLEAGGLRETPQSDDVYRGELCDAAGHPEPHLYRLRALGGSTREWGGGCVPFDKIDFESRPWVPGPGWPYDLDALIPFYRQAQQAAEAGRYDYQAPSPLIQGVDGERFQSVLERFSRPTDFGKRWRKELAPSKNVRIILNASATDMRLTPDGRAVDWLEAAAPDGRRITVRARRIVLAMGGLETTRLMLAANKDRPNGLGNDHDWLGRSYMCHLAAVSGSVTVFGSPRNVTFGHSRDSDGVYYRRRLLLSEQVQREHGLLNLAFRLQTQDPSDPAHGDAALSALHLFKQATERRNDHNYRYEQSAPRSTARHLWNVARNPGRLALAAATTLSERYLGGRRAPSIALRAANNRYALEFHGEQAPNPDSRVALSTNRDAFGMPRLKIQWRPHPLDISTVLHAYRFLGEELKRTAAGRLDVSEDKLLDQISTAGAYGGHHIGTTRIAVDPKQGVVDANCRVHGLANLFVASSSAMPTSGQANPTLTLLALTYKLAAHLLGLPANI